MTLNTALAAAATLVALAFGLQTLDRWLRRHRRHDLAWTIAMFLFVVASGALWGAEARGWNAESFRVILAFGAVINVPWLGLGTVYLLAGTRAGDAVARWLIGFSGFALGAIIMAPLKTPIQSREFPTAKEHFGPLPRILAAVGSGVPAVVIFAGAGWSAWRVLRQRQPAMTTSAARTIFRPRVLATGNVLIAAGAAVLSASGTFSGRLGMDRSFVITLFVGICILFAGFMVASQASRPSSSDAIDVALRELLNSSSEVRDGESSR